MQKIYLEVLGGPRFRYILVTNPSNRGLNGSLRQNQGIFLKPNYDCLILEDQ